MEPTGKYEQLRLPSQKIDTARLTGLNNARIARVRPISGVILSSRVRPKLAQKSFKYNEYNSGINTVLWDCIPLLYSRSYIYNADLR